MKHVVLSLSLAAALAGAVAEWAAAYRAGHERFRALYPALRAVAPAC